MANERRLIDANGLKRLVKGFRDEAPHATARKHACNVILSMLGNENQTPTVDAVEVVRCVQCYWNDRAGRCMNPKCGKSWYGCPVPDEHFCSYGEKREVE